MRITGNFESGTGMPADAAKAYGVRRPQVSTSALRSDSAFQSPQQRSTVPPALAQRLIAAKVATPVIFDDPAQQARLTSPYSAGVYQLYSRAADKIEAAVGVQLGRTIDLKG